MKKFSKRAAVLVAVMLVGAIFCAPVFAASNDVQYEGVGYNGVAIGYVGVFTGGGSGQWQSSNVITDGTGVFIDAGAKNFQANGLVGRFYGQTQGNIIGDNAIGAVVGVSNNSIVNGTVGVFKDSYNNKLVPVWVESATEGEGYWANSVGASVTAGNHNTATGSVGLFTNAGTKDKEDSGNIIYASTGAAVEGGNRNTATGVVGEFIGREPNVAYGGTNPGHGGVNQNIVLSSTGAVITGGNNNHAFGTVGSFDLTVGSNYDSRMAGNTVQGTGAYIMGGNNNLAIGSVGIFKGGMNDNNRVTGVGVVIAAPAQPK